MADSLLVKDGNGVIKNLEVVSGSVAGNIVPVHAITGSISSSLSAEQMQQLTGSMYAVSSSVVASFDKFGKDFMGALATNGSASFNVDIIAGDVNAITGAIDLGTNELKKLTALSGAQGLKVYGNLSASLDKGSTPDNPLNVRVSSSVAAPVYVSLANTGSLTASVAVSNWPAVGGTPVYVAHSGTISASIVADYAATVVTGCYTFTQAQTEQTALDTAAKTLTIANQANNMLFVTLDGRSPSPTNYSLAIDPFSTYEAMAQNARLTHKFILTGSANAGRVVYTITK